ncbi:hypothetical protein LN650_27360 [Klebsiella pneumoniae subsp. pneumoniae]|nr:hypothetical protein [Klebsiella pneumoniae subsp. pneumoniae]
MRKDTKGLIARWKYFWMSVIALGVAFALYLAGRRYPRQPSWWCRSLKT